MIKQLLPLGAFTIIALQGGLAQADTLQFAGVLGNSGEQGSSLVKFGPGDVSGMGVIADEYGSLWDRAGSGTLNRYAADGRLLASYKLPVTAVNRNDDGIVLVSKAVVLRLGKGLYALPVDAPTGTVPQALNVTADMISRSSHNGWLAAAQGKDIFLVNATGEKKPVGKFEGTLRGLEMGPDGVVYPYDYNGVQRLTEGGTATPLGPVPGERPQLLDGYWYGSGWHSTLRRFDAQLKPDPGVVLGGNSGSFIGHVDEQSEIINPRGLAKVGENLFAVSGLTGVLHLLQWSPADSRFLPVRRLGSVQNCLALGLDRDGRVWYHSGNWNWDDGPTAPLRYGIPGGPTFGAAMLDTDAMVAYGQLHRKPAFYYGKLGNEVRQSQTTASKLLTGEAVAVVSSPFRKRRALLVLDKKGAAASVYVDGNGGFQADAGTSMLHTADPVQTWTSLGSLGADSLLAGADGFVLEFERDGDLWQESKRWNSWGDKPAERFGASVHVTADSGRIWVADTARQRVLCFDAATRKLLASYGTTDAAGDTLTTLNTPRIISARGSRAVVFDSANQRLVRLEFRPDAR